MIFFALKFGLKDCFCEGWSILVGSWLDVYSDILVSML